MPEWSEVASQHVNDAIAECDRLGSREFLGRYRFGRAHDAVVWHGGEEYDARALMGLAYVRATGNTVPVEEFAAGGEDGAVRRLRELDFDVEVDETLTPPPRKVAAPRATASGATAPRATRTRTPKASPAPKRNVIKGRDSSTEPTICPTCFMALPATGICDNCD